VVRAIPVMLAVAAIALVALWLRASPSFDLKARLETPAVGRVQYHEVSFPGQFAETGIQAEALPGTWSCFRGDAHDAVSRDETPLARTWGPQGPKVLWSIPVGIGYAGAAIRNGRVYVLDYDEAKQADALRCLSLADGREIWRRWYEIPIDSDHGVSRTVPAVTDKYVVTLGPKCHVMCVDAATGAFRWGMDLVKQYGTTVPKWYAGQCPLVDGGRAILAPAGPQALMMAVDCESGKTLWTTPNPHGWKMTHSSVIPMEFAGRRMYIYSASGGAAGVAAEDGPTWKAGDVLWERDDWRVNFANVPAPVPVGEGKILLTGGYGTGSMMIQLKESGGRIAAEKVWRLEKSREFGSEQQTPVFYSGYVYGILPKEAGALGGQLVCLDPGGKQVWTSGPGRRFGLGPLMIAGGMILAMDDNGLMTVAEASPAGFKPLAQARVLDGHETWAPMAIAGGRLIVRDLQRMICLDLRPATAQAVAVPGKE
jgi:outer membrane protein assembly factor BamB